MVCPDAITPFSYVAVPMIVSPSHDLNVSTEVIVCALIVMLGYLSYICASHSPVIVPRPVIVPDTTALSRLLPFSSKPVMVSSLS